MNKKEEKVEKKSVMYYLPIDLLKRVSDRSEKTRIPKSSIVELALLKWLKPSK